MVDQRAPGLVDELPRLAVIGATLLGIVGNPAHTYGYHLPPSRLPGDDYSLRGALNKPVGDYACALDVGMDWPASREHLRWAIAEIAADRIKGVSEVIGSLDGRTARYWSDKSGWHPGGSHYTGAGHINWVHFGIYRSTARIDHKLYAGWGPNGRTEEDDMFTEDDRKLLRLAAHGGANAARRGEAAVVALTGEFRAWIADDTADDAEYLRRLDEVDARLVDVGEAVAALPGADPEAWADRVVEQLLPHLPAGADPQVYLNALHARLAS